MHLERGDRVVLPSENKHVTVDAAIPGADGLVTVYYYDGDSLRRRDLNESQLAQVIKVTADGGASPTSTLAGLWTEWMRQAAESVEGVALGSAPLHEYLHQHEAVYGHMLPQPMLRFLLADEPGTGKTIMGGLYVTEATRLGIIKRVLVVCPAHLIGKWQSDISRFFGLHLRRITSDTIREHALEASDHPLWIVSLHLAAMNPQIRQAIDPDVAGWDLVIVDEAHRLSPRAQTFYQVGLTAVVKAPRALLLTATPHRGSEVLFRSLMYLTDPEVFPEPTDPNSEVTRRLQPGPIHFVRRMKEELVDLDLTTPLFKKRTAHNIPVSLNLDEHTLYYEALRIVDVYFPVGARGLAGMVYGKRAASSLYGLRETLQRRDNKMGTVEHPSDPESDEEDNDEDLQRVLHEQSLSAKDERREVRTLIGRIDTLLNRGPDMPVSKWPHLVDRILPTNNITPGGTEQLVIFTEYADTAEWLTQRLQQAGYSAEMYSGRQPHPERETVRGRFITGDFQIIVSTDAGNEGIDLQTARVLINWDVPWSLVTLEQRLGRIHRVGQDRDVDLYNLIATETREGDAHLTLLNNLVNAANELEGRMFDSLALVGEQALAEETGVDRLENWLARAFRDDNHADVLSAITKITKDRVRQIHARVRNEDELLASRVDQAKALAGINQQRLDRINPHIVERYLSRLEAADILTLSKSAAADDGLYHLKPKRLDPLPFGDRRGVLVATSGEAKRRAIRQVGNAAEPAVPLGPNEQPFRDLAQASATALHADLYQGGALIDPTTLTDYRLFCFTATIRQSRIQNSDDRWRRTSQWSYLVKVDNAGTRIVPWETLANLEADTAPHPSGQHPAELTNAEAQARHQAEGDATKHQHTLDVWQQSAATNLRLLPNNLTDGIENEDEQRSARSEVSAAIERRIDELKAASALDVGDVELVGWAHIQATAEPLGDDEKTDSELVAMQHVTQALNRQGWSVADVHTERLGYDLKATKGSRMRAVEVKGVQDAASTSGIRLTGAELATAGMHGPDYWLYVVEHCADGKGQLFAAWPDPATVFANATKDLAVLQIKGSDLVAAKERTT